MAKPIMIQGTMSNVGKSIVTAGLCRLLKQDGFKVAPFKSQNMALNIFVTANGLEMSRAQAIQAEAAGIEPTASMNPVLLKPLTDQGSEVVVNGRVIGKMSAAEYYEYKDELMPIIKRSYDELAEANDIIVAEGAGSPVELNLNSRDIVNMGLAKALNAPVLLVSDIDRGGVFAQTAGTVSLLDENERALLKGIIVNKFRGDSALFSNGIKIIEEKTGKKVVGILPYLDINIENEDSMRDYFVKSLQHYSDTVHIAIVNLPRMTNASDFLPLEIEKNARVLFVKNAEQLQNADLIILPGTADIQASVDFLADSGIAHEIERIAKVQSAAIFGIAEGYALLFKSLHLEEADSSSLRAEAKTIKGLAVFDESCVLERLLGGAIMNCELTCEVGFWSGLKGKKLSASVIGGMTTRIGKIAQTKMTSFAEFNDGQFGGRLDGYCEGCVAGTSLHTFFYSDDCRNALIAMIRASKGLSAEGVCGYSVKEYKNEQFDKLADCLRRNLDMEFIYNIIGV